MYKTKSFKLRDRLNWVDFVYHGFDFVNKEKKDSAIINLYEKGPDNCSKPLLERALKDVKQEMHVLKEKLEKIPSDTKLEKSQAVDLLAYLNTLRHYIILVEGLGEAGLVAVKTYYIMGLLALERFEKKKEKGTSPASGPETSTGCSRQVQQELRPETPEPLQAEELAVHDTPEYSSPPEGTQSICPTGTVTKLAAQPALLAFLKLRHLTFFGKCMARLELRGSAFRALNRAIDLFASVDALHENLKIGIGNKLDMKKGTFNEHFNREELYLIDFHAYIHQMWPIASGNYGLCVDHIWKLLNKIIDHGKMNDMCLKFVLRSYQYINIGTIFEGAINYAQMHYIIREMRFRWKEVCDAGTHLPQVSEDVRKVMDLPMVEVLIRCGWLRHISNILSFTCFILRHPNFEEQPMEPTKFKDAEGSLESKYYWEKNLDGSNTDPNVVALLYMSLEDLRDHTFSQMADKTDAFIQQFEENLEMINLTINSYMPNYRSDDIKWEPDMMMWEKETRLKDA